MVSLWRQRWEVQPGEPPEGLPSSALHSFLPACTEHLRTLFYSRLFSTGILSLPSSPPPTCPCPNASSFQPLYQTLPSLISPVPRSCPLRYAPSPWRCLLSGVSSLPFPAGLKEKVTREAPGWAQVKALSREVKRRKTEKEISQDHGASSLGQHLCPTGEQFAGVFSLPLPTLTGFCHQIPPEETSPLSHLSSWALWDSQNNVPGRD